MHTWPSNAPSRTSPKRHSASRCGRSWWSAFAIVWPVYLSTEANTYPLAHLEFLDVQDLLEARVEIDVLPGQAERLTVMGGFVINVLSLFPVTRMSPLGS